jgi:hypothetical protein
MSELNVYHHELRHNEYEEFYLKYEADKVIAEKDKEIAELKAKLMPCLNGDCILTCEVVEKYGKENAELKAKLEDVKASAYAENVDAGMRERRLRRLLWHAIALFCARSCEYFNGIMSHCLIGQDDLYKRAEKKKNKYLHATYKCRAKTEEYK